MATKYLYKVQYGIFWGFWELTRHFKTQAQASEFASRIVGEWCIRDAETNEIIDMSQNYKS